MTYRSDVQCVWVFSVPRIFSLFPPFCHQPWQHILFLSTLNEKNISFFAIAPFVRVPFHTTPSMLEAFIADRHDLCWNSTSALIAKVLLVLEHKRLIHNYKLLNWELQLYKKKNIKILLCRVVKLPFRFYSVKGRCTDLILVEFAIWFYEKNERFYEYKTQLFEVVQDVV